jgi:hypothetical protein
VGDTVFLGSVWEQSSLPQLSGSLSSESRKKGTLIWGVAEQVFDALIGGNIAAIEEAEFTESIGHFKNATYVYHR